MRASRRHLTGTARPGPSKESPKPAPPSSWQRRLFPIAIGVGLLALFLLLFGTPKSAGKSLAYSDFVARVNSGQVATVRIDDKGAVRGTLKKGGSYTSQIPTALDNAGLENLLRARGVRVTATRGGGLLGSILWTVLPLLFIVGLFWWSGRAAQRSLAGGVGGFGRSKATIIEAQRPTTRLTNRQIGERLYLAEKAVKNYVSGLFAKLDISRRTQAAAFITQLKADQATSHRDD